MEEKLYYIDNSFFSKDNLDQFNFVIFKVGNRKVVVKELALILTSKKIPLLPNKHGDLKTIDGSRFTIDFANGFDDGVSYFDRSFKATPEIIYGNNSESFIRSLHQNYYHKHEFDYNFGWKHWINSYPEIISKSVIRKYGFYAGIISQFNRIVDKHPAAFVGFERCFENEKTDSSVSKISDQEKVEKHEYSLRRFIDMATRWKIEAAYKTVSKEFPFTALFDNYIKEAPANLESFRVGLKSILLNTKPESLRIQEIDFKDRFIPGIDLYLNWYKKNMDKLIVFGTYNPYQFMYEIAISTKRELQVYFPEAKSNLPSPVSVRSEVPTTGFGVLTRNNKSVTSDVLSELKDAGFVPIETKLADFNKVLSKSVIGNKISWIGSVSSLNLFVSELCKRNGLKRINWKTAIASFNLKFPIDAKNLQNNRTPSENDKVCILRATRHFSTNG